MEGEREEEGKGRRKRKKPHLPLFLLAHRSARAIREEGKKKVAFLLACRRLQGKEKKGEILSSLFPL